MSKNKKNIPDRLGDRLDRYLAKYPDCLEEEQYVTGAALSSFKKQKNILIEYLKHKVELEDWHGVSDAANDIRVLEASQVK